MNINKSQIIYAKKGRFILKNNNNFLILNDGSFIDINKQKITSFAFKKTEVNLSKYVTNSTTFPKVQEVRTKYLLNCLYNLYLNKNFNSATNFLVCNKTSQGDIEEESFKRIIKPFFIPTLVLIASLIILFNKDHFNYSKTQYILFFIGFFILMISEISARYITYNSIQIYFLIMPVIIFLVSYFYLIYKLKTKL
jgi:lipopolysaccharide export system permease protein